MTVPHVAMAVAALLGLGLLVALVAYSAPRVPRPPKHRPPGAKPWRSSGTGL